MRRRQRPVEARAVEHERGETCAARRAAPAKTSSAPAICGTSFGFTKLAASTRGSPVAASRAHSSARTARLERHLVVLEAVARADVAHRDVHADTVRHYARMLVRDVLLRDGSALRLRAPEPDDFEAIRDFYDNLSPESRYMRFHGFGRSDGPARAYAEADGEARLALIGAQGGRIVAAAGYDRLREPGAAEVAFTVADDFQGRGAASRLLEQLAQLAAERGIARFDAEVLADNTPMLRVFKRAGFDIRRRSEFGEVTVSLALEPTEAVRERRAERDHRAAVASLRPFLAPASVAVVGDPDGLGGAVLANLREGGFTGTVSTEPPAELVVIAAWGDEALAAAEVAAAKGAKGLLVLSAGFAEEPRMLEIARSGGLRMIGPNCLGVLNTAEDVRLNATYAGARVAPGRLAICSQSGAVGMALLGHAAARRLGVSSFASLGNRADVSTNDLLELWEDDERTTAVLLYLETFGNPERFARIARRVSRRKPILAVKGRHPGPPEPAGELGSHTAAALRGDAVAGRAAARGGGSALPQRRAALPDGRALRAPAAAGRATGRHRQQLGGDRDARRRRLRRPRAARGRRARARDPGPGRRLRAVRRRAVRRARRRRGGGLLRRAARRRAARGARGDHRRGGGRRQAGGRLRRRCRRPPAAQRAARRAELPVPRVLRGRAARARPSGASGCRARSASSRASTTWTPTPPGRWSRTGAAG